MKKLVFILFAFVLFSSHDMFLKLDTFFLQPNTPASIKLFNGTFEKSDNVIARNRMIDVSLVGNGQRSQVDTTQWSEKDSMTILNFKTGEAGTWVAGVSTRARNIEMTAKDFNGYLEHDGVIDMLDWRKKNNALDQDAVEKYSKHVKTIFQVGDKKTNDWQTVLGYPIEFVPLSNPYDLHAGNALKVKLLWQGQPLANQLVYIGSNKTDHGHSHDHSHEGDDHHHHGTMNVRTNAKGILSFDLANEGIWYMRTIHLVNSEEAGLTHESNWATLTFEVGHGHNHSHAHDGHSHEHDGHSHADGGHTHEDGTHHTHAEEEGLGIPSYVFWIGSLVLIAGLFLWFNRDN